MVCPSCGKRAGRRPCPALGRQICTVCCGTKRLVEIRCVPTCGYLVTARTHPPAIERRQHEHDLQALAPALRDLSESQTQLLFLLFTFLAEPRMDDFIRATDVDMADCAGSVAATLETADRGLIYEHRPGTLPAQRLAADLKAFLAELPKSGWKPQERDVAVVLRRIETGAREALKSPGGDDSAFLGLVRRAARSFQASHPEHPGTPSPAEPRLVVP
jgi:hypothetical protein